MPKRSLFGTSGIRGPADTLFTDQFSFDIGKTFISFLKKSGNLGPIAVGMDPRTSSPRIKRALLKGLGTGGVPLFDEGVTPIPSMNWLIKSTPVVAGIMITGSHIAPELNGVKFYAHEEEISTADQDMIEATYFKLKEKEKISDGTPTVKLESRAKELYAEMLANIIKKPLPKWKVALDCANGSQSVVMPKLLKRLGLEVVKVNCDPQKDFIARDTDTDDKAEIDMLKSTVIKEKCDFGIAFDGDGDRVIFIDELGQFVLGEYSCSLVAKNIPGDTIITTISASQVVDTLGKKVIRTKVGSPYIVGKMKEHEVEFGFEPNGGAVSGEIMYTRDGGTMTMKIFNLFSKFKGTFSEMVGKLPKYYMARTKVDYRWELQEMILDEAKKIFKGVKTEEIDGLKIWIDESSWILFRSSQNAPEFRVFAESKDKKTTKILLTKGVDFVNKIIKSN